MDEKERRKISITSFIAVLIFILLAVAFSFGRSIIEKINLSALALTGEVKITTKPDELTVKAKQIKQSFKSAKKLIKVKRRKKKSSPQKVKVVRKRPPEKGFYRTSSTQDAVPVIKVNSKKHIVIGSGNWSGPDDISFKCSLTKKSNGFHVFVVVKDNVLWAENPNLNFKNDCIEIYFDVRPESNRGKSNYENRAVYQITAVPFFGNKKKANTAAFRTGGKVVKPPKDYWVKSRKIPGGYKIAVFIPFSIFKYQPGDEFNFDIGMIDYDGKKMKTQIVWSGVKENYASAKYFGHMKPAK